MDCAPIRAQAWLDEHLPDLQGLGLEDALALVEGAGLLPRVVPYPSGWMTQEQRSDRVNLWLTETGAIGSIDAG